ncbi:sialoadhesin isoform X2 [Pangasianodon hypophthalmus]|nr:sialoadhesin isoform X2 [Pangasianodon hypophthalmus]
MTNFSSTLTITDLRERDSGEYRLMFFTDKGEKYLSSAGVTLTVTDLQVTRDSTEQALTCRTSCLLTSALHRYYWYRNGQYLKKYTDNMETFPLRNAEDGSYSCSFHGYNNIHSPPLCVNRNCLSVTYPEKRVCVLEGSSVEFAGSYSHSSDQRVSKAFWHSHKDFQDLKQETQFTNRVEYVNKNRSCTLKMNQLTKKDSGEYRFRFLTNDGEKFSGRPGVVLSVTDLQVRVSHSAVASEGQTTVTLSCIASCTLSNNPTYMWYKNGQPVTNKLTKHNKLYLISSEDAGDYSCAVRGREDLRSPEQTVTLSEAGPCPGCVPGEEGNGILIAVGVTVFLALIIIAGALWMWRRKSKSVKSHSCTEGTDPQSGQDDVQYSSIHFQSAGGKFPRDTTVEESVQYAEVNIRRPPAAT